MRTKVNVAFTRAEHEKGLEKIVNLIEAQFYMRELEWREEKNWVRRDFRMELAIMLLIGLELFVAVGGMVLAFRESKGQSQVMERVVQGLERVEKAVWQSP